ncbi:hypothetical protein [Neobacillus mesonae]|uniref:hypothetical protein n=1 Tax=Neobacillus mesonae TaxID=1193713 RepID=UPI0020408A3D|nr:hypothetical protein [Neobacillus mesonae]MCM3570286.1 hypothetical protein [Neobacillus mesonae]
MSKKQQKQDEKDKPKKESSKTLVVNQGLSNKQALPVKVVDSSSRILGGADNPFPVTVQNPVAASLQAAPRTGTSENQIPPGSSALVEYDTSNFREVIVWFQLVSSGRVDVEIFSQIRPSQDSNVTMNISETSFNLTINQPVVKMVPASGTTTAVLLKNPSATEPIHVLAALKGNG